MFASINLNYINKFQLKIKCFSVFFLFIFIMYFMCFIAILDFIVVFKCLVNVLFYSYRIHHILMIYKFIHFACEEKNI